MICRQHESHTQSIQRNISQLRSPELLFAQWQSFSRHLQLSFPVYLWGMKWLLQVVFWLKRKKTDVLKISFLGPLEGWLSEELHFFDCFWNYLLALYTLMLRFLFSKVVRWIANSIRKSALTIRMGTTWQSHDRGCMKEPFVLEDKGWLEEATKQARK